MKDNKEGTQRVGSYILKGSLGEGSTSRVRLGVHEETNKKYAIKIVSKSYLSLKPKLIKKVASEILILKLLNHPNIVKIHDVFETKNYLFVVLEYFPSGSLLDYVQENPYFTTQNSVSTSLEALFIFRQVIYGLEYVHQQNISHRDLKLENLLLDKRRSRIGISDFGMAKHMKNGDFLTSQVGSPHYIAPEVIRGEDYDGKLCDIWSCGIILYVLLYRRFPFDSKSGSISRILKRILHGKLRFPKGATAAEMDILKRMLKKDPKERISLSEIKSHDFFIVNFPLGYMPPKQIIKPRTYTEEDLDSDIINDLLKLINESRESVVAELLAPESRLKQIYHLLEKRVPGYRKRKNEERKKKETNTRITAAQYRKYFKKEALKNRRQIQDGAATELNGWIKGVFQKDGQKFVFSSSLVNPRTRPEDFPYLNESDDDATLDNDTKFNYTYTNQSEETEDIPLTFAATSKVEWLEMLEKNEISDGMDFELNRVRKVFVQGITDIEIAFGLQKYCLSRKVSWKYPNVEVFKIYTEYGKTRVLIRRKKRKPKGKRIDIGPADYIVRFEFRKGDLEKFHVLVDDIIEFLAFLKKSNEK